MAFFLPIILPTQPELFVVALGWVVAINNANKNCFASSQPSLNKIFFYIFMKIVSGKILLLKIAIKLKYKAGSVRKMNSPR